MPRRKDTKSAVPGVDKSRLDSVSFTAACASKIEEGREVLMLEERWGGVLLLIEDGGGRYF